MVNKISKLAFGIFQIAMIVTMLYVYMTLKNYEPDPQNPFGFIEPIMTGAKYFVIWQVGTLLLGFCALIYNSNDKNN